MYPMVSSLCPQTNMEGTLLTREQIEEISTRISQKVSENVTKQLEKAISFASSNNEFNKIEQGKKDK